MPVRCYRDLKVWQSAIELVTAVYRLADSFPRREDFGLSSQMQRAAVSIPSNIAEGHARVSDKEFAHFLSIVLGSLAELETQLMISERLGYAGAEEVEKLLSQADGIGKQVRSLQKTVKNSHKQPAASSQQLATTLCPSTP